MLPKVTIGSEFIVKHLQIHKPAFWQNVQHLFYRGAAVSPVPGLPIDHEYDYDLEDGAGESVNAGSRTR
jgi:hypothetical protein